LHGGISVDTIDRKMGSTGSHATLQLKKCSGLPIRPITYLYTQVLDDRSDPQIPNPEVLRTLKRILWVESCGVSMPWIDHIQILQTLAISFIDFQQRSLMSQGMVGSSTRSLRRNVPLVKVQLKILISRTQCEILGTFALSFLVVGKEGSRANAVA